MVFPLQYGNESVHHFHLSKSKHTTHYISHILASDCIPHLIKRPKITDCRIYSVEVIQKTLGLLQIIGKIIMQNRSIIRNQNRQCGISLLKSNICIRICNDYPIFLTILMSHLDPGASRNFISVSFIKRNDLSVHFSHAMVVFYCTTPAPQTTMNAEGKKNLIRRECGEAAPKEAAL